MDGKTNRSTIDRDSQTNIKKRKKRFTSNSNYVDFLVLIKMLKLPK